MLETGSSRDDDLDINLNDLNLECFDDPLADQAINAAVLGPNFAQSGMLVFNFKRTFLAMFSVLGTIFFHYCDC